MTRPFLIAAAALAASCATPADAPGARVALHRVDAAGGAEVGEITFAESREGVEFRLHLHGLPPGDHGMHVHANASCDAAPNATGQMTPAGGAGGHFDPGSTGRHEGPMGAGHLGDLPFVHVGVDGTADMVLHAPHLRSVADLRGHAIVIHANGDNYSDTPAPLGGGGGRIACGVIS